MVYNSRKRKMITKLIGQNYVIEEKGTSKYRKLSICVNVDSGGGITIFGKDTSNDFTFINSKPEMVVKIGKMIAKAGTLALTTEDKPKKRTYTKRKLPEFRSFYCVRCRAKKTTSVFQTVTMKNGKKAYRAVDACGTTMFKIG